MAGIDIKTGGGAISLTKDIYVNNANIGPFDSTSDVKVYLQNTLSAPITPVSSVLVGNDLTITANIPVPSGVALQWPNPSVGISYRNFDTGWRAQNNWYNYTPPTYPAKYAQLDTTLGSNQWYRLKTALTVGGVTSTERFVDVNGVQSWGSLNNANFAVVDKLTGLMFTRTPITIGAGFANWEANIASAAAYSIVINGVTYSDWYTIGMGEMMSILGTYCRTTNWADGITSQNIITGINNNGFLSAEPTLSNLATIVSGYIQWNANGGFYTTFNANLLTYQTLWIHNATSLIS